MQSTSGSYLTCEEMRMLPRRFALLAGIAAARLPRTLRCDSDSSPPSMQRSRITSNPALASSPAGASLELQSAQSSPSVRLCIVTGGSSGIGAAVCGIFATRGYQVLSVARGPCPCEGVHSVLADLSEDGSLDQVVSEVQRILQGVPASICLVHNASNYPSDSASAVDVAGMRRALQLNVIMPAALTSKLVPLMGPSSSVIFVGSTLSEKAVAGKLSYCTAKHAMVGLMRGVAQDLLWSGVHTALVCPGITDTKMVREAVAGQEEAFARFVQGLQGRVLEPSEIARVIWDVAQTPVLHGTVLHCNGGQRES